MSLISPTILLTVSVVMFCASVLHGAENNMTCKSLINYSWEYQGVKGGEGSHKFDNGDALVYETDVDGCNACQQEMTWVQKLADQYLKVNFVGKCLKKGSNCTPKHCGEKIVVGTDQVCCCNSESCIAKFALANDKLSEKGVYKLKATAHEIDVANNLATNNFDKHTEKPQNQETQEKSMSSHMFPLIFGSFVPVFVSMFMH